MDVGLSGISGIEATEQIRKIERDRREAAEADGSGGNQRDVMIFGLTGNVAESNLRQYEAAGMNGCIVKGKLLVEAVRQAVDRLEREPNVFVNIAGA